MKNIFIIALAFLLASCSIDRDNSTQEKIANLEKQITEITATASTGMILFEKKTRCAGLANDIEKRRGSIAKEYPDLGSFTIGGIFYSPVRDACLWVRLTDTYAKDGSPLQRRALYEYGDDFGATEPIIGCEKILDEPRGTNTCETYETELRKLRGTENENTLNP
ncbi:TPA: hypothetical protein DCZ36_01010 [Candidatus Gracilibacteria bacterium]|nr:hypothetical protein [Candidatus Gracilibacteria bacterium]